MASPENPPPREPALLAGLLSVLAGLGLGSVSLTLLLFGGGGPDPGEGWGQGAFLFGLPVGALALTGAVVVAAVTALERPARPRALVCLAGALTAALIFLLGLSGIPTLHTGPVVVEWCLLLAPPLLIAVGVVACWTREKTTVAVLSRQEGTATGGE